MAHCRHLHRPPCRRWSLAAALLCALACRRGPTLPGGKAPSIHDFGRSPGMPIGTENAANEQALVSHFNDAAEAPRELAAKSPAAGEADPAAAAKPPCSGCVELNVYVNDINQRDEFAFELNDARLVRIVWTLAVTFNSDQLAVQPFADKQQGEYTKLHVENFPLGTPIEVAQTVKGRVSRVGLSVGSSGAWTGDQVLRVFVTAVRAEGPDGFEHSFESSAEGLAPRTNNRQPQVVFHPGVGAE